jgi:hypothetical protein
VAAGGVVLAILASSEGVMGELADTEASKLDLVRAAFRPVADFPLFGIGRGAFESVFPAYRTDTGYLIYTHPEDLPAQWVTEWGIVAAVVAFVVLAVALRPASALSRSPRAAGAWAALAGFFVHDLVNFGSEYPALVLALAVCAAIVTGGTSGVDEGRLRDGWARRPLALAASLALVTGFALVLAVTSLHKELFDDREALHAAAIDRAVTRREFDGLARAAMLRHPAEPYLPYTGAMRAARTGESSILAWMDRTFDRARVYGPAHLLLARALAPRSPSQARLEYRLAIEQAPGLPSNFVPALPTLVSDFDDAVELLPRGPQGAFWAGVIAAAVAPRLPATAERLYSLARSRSPDDYTLVARRATDALADVLTGESAPWCFGAHRVACLTDALDRATDLIRADPSRCSGHAVHARIVFESGDGARAVSELRAAAEGVSDRVACLEELTDLALRARSDDAATQALDRIAHAGCNDAAECVKNLRFVAGRESGRGNDGRALAALNRARQIEPTDDILVADAATLASKVGSHAEALRLYQGLAARHAGDGHWQAAVAAEKASLMNEALP